MHQIVKLLEELFVLLLTVLSREPQWINFFDPPSSGFGVASADCFELNAVALSAH